MSLIEIYSGFKNLIFKDEEIEPIAEVRLIECFNCPHRNNNRCGKCGCILAAKVRSTTTKCPDERW